VFVPIVLAVNDTKYSENFEISDFRREVDKNCSLLGYCAACSKNCLPTFRGYLSVLSSRVKNVYP
jgi:hypothetical protein